MTAGIYKIVNTANQKTYIGSAVNLKNRWRRHVWELDRGSHPNLPLQRSWKKRGNLSFTFVILEVVPSKTLLLEREQFWLDTQHPEYNICKKAGSILGIKRSPATIAKMTGQKRTPEQCAHIGAALLGKKRPPLSAEHKEKIRLSSLGKNAGKSMSAENRAAMAVRHLGTTASEATKAKMSAAAMGRPKGPMSAIHKARLAAANNGKKQSAETIARRQQTRQANKASTVQEVTDVDVHEVPT